jgi:hypothetical protein
MSLNWDDVRRHFAHDEGWFCDVIVPSADAELRDLLDLIQQRGWAYEYAEDGERRRLPPYDDIKQAQQQRAPLLTFWPGGTLPLNVHFFDEAVETTFDPRNLHGQEDLDALVAYMRVLGRHFGSPIAVTVESRPDLELLRYEPHNDCVVRVPTA